MLLTIFAWFVAIALLVPLAALALVAVGFVWYQMFQVLRLTFGRRRTYISFE